MRSMSIGVIILIIMALVPLPAFANTPIEALAEVETLLYGEIKGGALLQRIENVERDIFGELQNGAVLMRIDRVNSFLVRNQSSGVSLRLQLNLAEWGFLEKLTDGQPLVKRLAQLETDLLGTPQEGSLAERSREMMMMIWGTTELDVKTVELKEASLVRIQLLTEIDSSKMTAGDAVHYEVAEDVKVDGRVVIPKGARGSGRVSDVSAAGRLGRDGKIEIEFNTLPALDGTQVRIKVDERATEKNISMELAAGASMAGVLLLGPIGLVGGYFVKGQDVKIPIRTEFYVETERNVRTSGFLLRPAQGN